MSSRIADFLEGEIRRAILHKAPLGRINKTGKHWKGYIYVDGVLVGKVKIPNSHSRVMKASRSIYVARDLQLTASEFNDFVFCTMSATDYCTNLSEK
jgi:hypothetical protein